MSKGGPSNYQKSFSWNTEIQRELTELVKKKNAQHQREPLGTPSRGWFQKQQKGSENFCALHAPEGREPHGDTSRSAPETLYGL